MFSSTVTEHWLPMLPDEAPAGAVRVVVDSSLGASQTLSLLRVHDGPTVLRLTPSRARELSLSEADSVHAAQLAISLAEAGITLNSPDHLCYLPAAEQAKRQNDVMPNGTRLLTIEDAGVFAEFAAKAPADDLDEAFVELDHWLVFGSFVDGVLAAASSMYPWGGTRLADLGVITLPEFRGRGLARTTVQAISAEAIQRGYEPQYRCQLDNAPSIALAESAGFARFGEWEVAV